MLNIWNGFLFTIYFTMYRANSLSVIYWILGFRKVSKLVSKWYQTSINYSKFNIWVMTHLYEFIVNLSIKLVPNWYRTGTVRSPSSDTEDKSQSNTSDN